MKKIFDFIYGAILGIANIIPGASGGTIAVITGIFDRLMDNLSNIYKTPLKCIKNLIFIILGIIFGLLCGMFAIEKLIEVAPIPTYFFFSGLIIGGIPFLLKKVKDKPKNSKSWIILVISFVFIIGLTFLTDGTNNEFSFNIVSIIILFVLGSISFMAMVLPGVSGSMIISSLGYYDSVLGLLTNTVSDLASFTFTTDLILLLSFGLGGIIGIICFAKVIKYLFEKYFVNTFMCILGLVSASSVGVIILAIRSDGTSLLWLGIITLILGIISGYFLTKLEGEDKDMIDFKELVNKYKDESLKTLIDVLSIDTVLDEYKEDANAPFGEGNLECLNYMLNKAKEDNFETLNVDNYACHIDLGTKGDLIGVLGHLDVVPTVGDWKYDPFTPTIEGDKLIARGTLDDKGPVVACYYALKILKDLNIEMNHKIRLILGSDEESGSRCMKRYFSKVEKPDYGFSPDADFPVIYGEKGIMGLYLEGNLELNNIKSIKAGTRLNIVCDEVICEFNELDSNLFNKFLKDNNYKGEVEGNTVKVFGSSAHAMTPHLGVNAIYLLMEFINEYYPNELSNYFINTFDTTGNKLNINHSDEQMGELTINLGILTYENNKINIGYNLRVPKDELVDGIVSAFKNNVLKLETKHSYSKAHYVDPNSDFVQKLMAIYQECTGDTESKPFTIGGGTYAREIPNAVAFGPHFKGREDVVHQPNEYIYLEDFYKWIEIYAKALYLLVK